jgi:N4-gp56 family major capsid protein
MYAQKRGDKNPIFTGALGVYNNVILFESQRIFSPATYVYRNLFLGAQAGVFCVGGAYDSIEKSRVGKDNIMSWYEEIDDYGNEKGISVGSIFGMNKSVFNSEDYGLITVPSYSVAHT